MQNKKFVAECVIKLISINRHIKERKITKKIFSKFIKLKIKKKI